MAHASTLRLTLGNYTVGSVVPIEVRRGGRILTARLRLTAMSRMAALERLAQRVGIEVIELPEREAARQRLAAGTIAVRNVRRGSPAARVGLRVGHLVRAFNSEKV